MESLIAFCKNKNCGAIFQASNLISATGNATVTFKDVGYGPCPSCGSMGEIPDGVYSFVNNAISFLTGPETSVDLLRQVENILRKAKLGNANKEKVLNEIKNVSPKTALLLQKTTSNSNYLQWIPIYIALIALAIQIHTSYIKNDDNIEKKFRNHLLQENQLLRNRINQTLPYQREEPKVQRNKPCPCNSGLKYKKCCGRPDNKTQEPIFDPRAGQILLS